MAESRSRPMSMRARAADLAWDGRGATAIERLVDSGLRLNESRSESELHDFLIDEVTELSGAQRVLLVLDTDDGLRLAGSMLPPGESAARVLTAIEPWLVETRRTRSASLRHGPDGAEPTDQRSCRVQAQHAR